jgi:hypothetical protein
MDKKASPFIGTPPPFRVSAFVVQVARSGCQTPAVHQTGELFEHPLKLGALPTIAGDPLAKNLPSASFFEGLHL